MELNTGQSSNKTFLRLEKTGDWDGGPPSRTKPLNMQETDRIKAYSCDSMAQSKPKAFMYLYTIGCVAQSHKIPLKLNSLL